MAIVCHFVTFWSLNALLIVLDLLKKPLFLYKYKIQPHVHDALCKCVIIPLLMTDLNRLEEAFEMLFAGAGESTVCGSSNANSLCANVRGTSLAYTSAPFQCRFSCSGLKSASQQRFLRQLDCSGTL